MRILVKLKTSRSCKYVHKYHHKVQGRIWKALKNASVDELNNDTGDISLPNQLIDELHNTSEIPKFAFSNPFPRKEYDQNEISNLLISSPHPVIIELIQNSLEKNTEFNIGEMPFTVDEMSIITPDVGSVGSKGILQSSTGVYIPLTKEHREKYDIEGFRASDKISWTPGYTIQAFNERLIENVQWKLQTLQNKKAPTPDHINDLFEAIEFGDTYPVEIPIGNDVTDTFTFIVTQVRCEYTVTSQDHRRWLNTILDTGLGWRNTLSFGMLNDKQ